MSKKPYLMLAVICLIGAVIVFGFFILFMIDGSFLDDLSVTGLLLEIFMYLGLSMMFLVSASVFFMIYLRKGVAEHNVPMKTCPSCGQTMDIKEMSCPRCFTLQPVYDPRRDRK